MKKISVTLSFVLCASGAALTAHADDYGCRVILCLSNPQGPTAVPQCEPPIQRFLREQAKQPPDPFPSCPEAAPSTMRPAVRYYDACPDGSTELSEGVEAIKLSAAQFARMQSERLGGSRSRILGLTDSVTVQGSLDVPSYAGIGAGEAKNYGARDNKVCVAKLLGRITLIQPNGDQSTGSTYAAYETLSIIEPSSSPRVVDIFVDRALYRSVHY